jgi:hypothetical protein
MYDSMSERQLDEFASTKHEGKPDYAPDSPIPARKAKRSRAAKKGAQTRAANKAKRRNPTTKGKTANAKTKSKKRNPPKRAPKKGSRRGA